MTIQRKYLKTLVAFILFGACSSQPIEVPQTSDIRKYTHIDRLNQRQSAELACSINQYFDKEEGRCLGVPGGGKTIDIDTTQTCPDSNTLSVHCTNPRYYYICKEDKIILAECANGTHFDNRLQRCVYVDPTSFESSIITREDMPYRTHINLPSCTKLGKFPVTDNCGLFYVCTTNGHRLHQSAFKCPNGMGFNVEEQLCSTTPRCQNEKDLLKTLCLVNAKNENIRLESVSASDLEESSHIPISSQAETYDEESNTMTSLQEHPIAETTVLAENNLEKLTTVSIATSPEYEFEKLTTVPSAAHYNVKPTSVEPTVEYSTIVTLNDSEAHYGDLQDKRNDEEIVKQHLFHVSTTENYDRLERSTGKEESSFVVSPVSRSSERSAGTTDIPLSFTTDSQQISMTQNNHETTDKINMMTTASDYLSTTELLVLSTKPTAFMTEIKTTPATSEIVEALRASSTTQLHKDQMDTQPNPTTEKSGATVETLTSDLTTASFEFRTVTTNSPSNK